MVAVLDPVEVLLLEVEVEVGRRELNSGIEGNRPELLVLDDEAADELPETEAAEAEEAEAEAEAEAEVAEADVAEVDVAVTLEEPE